MSRAKLKKVLAGMLAATMVLGMSATTFAADTSDSGSTIGAGTSDSGSTLGAGTSEGHVKQEVVNMILPTVASGSTPFAYVMDPERLIQGTSGKKYAEGTVFPDATGDTGVYFLTAPNTYANTSNELQAINKSSCNVTLTVKVKADASATPDTDISLAKNSTLSTTSPELYLGLKVGQSTTTLTTNEQTVTKTIAGTPNNFELAVKNGAYVYQEKSTATTWQAMNISMTGAVSAIQIEEDTSAPTINVTWSYAKAETTANVDTADQVEYTTTPPAPPAADPEISSISEFNKAAPADVVIAFTAGSGDKAVEFDKVTLQQGASKAAVNAAKYTVDMDAMTVTIDKSAGFMTGASANVPIYVLLTKGDTTVKELSGTITIK